MVKAETTLIAVGGGEFSEADEVVDEFLGFLSDKPNARIVVLTVATNEPEGAIEKYNNLFRGRHIKHVESIDVSEREHSFSETSVKKIRRADALFFTGGDQLNVTSLVGGTPIHASIQDKVDKGVVLVGTSAGAAMMSKWMIISGESDHAPTVGSVETAPGMDLVNGMIIDTHFSQRGRHGRLLTAVAHFPQALGVGIDAGTAIVIRGDQFRVVGNGVVTIIDGNSIRLNDLPYRKEGETIGLAGAVMDVLPSGYKYNIRERKTEGPALRKLAGGTGNGGK
jgi:cyanophycinase